jgi:hypothetical protein
VRHEFFKDGAVTSPHDPSKAQPYPNPHLAAEPQERPRAVDAAFWIAIVVPVLATGLLAASLYQLQDLFTSATGGLPPEQRQLLNGQFGQNVVLVLFAAMLTFYLVLTALWIAFGFKLRAGRNWARITLTFFAAAWLVNALSAVATGSGPTGGLRPSSTGSTAALAIAQTALGLVGMLAFLVLVWNARSNRFFATARYAAARDEPRGEAGA